MKTKNLISKSWVILMVLLCQLSVTSGQSITFNLVQQPCNADGTLEYTVNGLSFPCQVVIYNSDGTQMQNYSLTSNPGVLNAYTGENIYFSITDGVNWVSGSYSAAPFNIAISTTDAVCPSLTGTAVATVTGGSAPYSYQWIESPTSTIVSTVNPANLPAGEYSLMVTDNNGCVFGSDFGGDSVYINNVSGMTLNTSTTPAGCTNGVATVNSITGGTAPYTYLWSNGASTASVNNLSMGIYSVTVTDVNGCYQPTSVYVGQSPVISVNNTTTPATCVQNDGQVMVFGSGGTPPYTYQHSNGASTQAVSGLTAGWYSATATDANGCTGTGWYSIISVSPVTATFSSTPSLCTSPTGSASITISGGTPPYNTVWSTFPVQTGTSASGLGAGGYNFYITDANGCTRTGTVNIPVQNPMLAGINTANTLCGTSNGTASMSVTGGTPPYSYLWNTSATTTGISNLAPGVYSCTVTDAAGCSITKSRGVSSVSPVQIGFSTTPASCIFVNDGMISSTIIGGTPPYSYQWSSGQTTSSVSSLAPGNYSLFVTDAGGCTKSSNVFVPYNSANNSCYCTITGTVYHDVNANCIQDGGELPMENVAAHCSGIGYSYTDANGVYSFIVPTGTYTVSEIIQAFYPLSACQNNSNVVSVTAASGCTTTVNFGNSINPIDDIHIINFWYTPPVPGSNFNLYSVVSNDGTTTANDIQLGFRHDGQLPFLGSGQVSYTQLDPANSPDWYSVTTGFPVLNAGDDMTVINNFMTPTNIPLGTLLWMRDTVCYQNPISDWLNDYTPWNNVHNISPVVVASYDPNFKEVYPKGTGPDGDITTEVEYLQYTIHFQNTGSWPADKVVIRDTLDSDLEWESVVPGWSDHNYITSMDENGVVTFTFDNINLPDGASNPIASMGMINYSVKLKPGLAIGTQITNSAAIYFDYNAPVITNTTINTIVNNVDGIAEIKPEELFFSVYPNPADESVTIVKEGTSEETGVVWEMSDISGKEVWISGNSSVSFVLPVSTFESGMYFVKMISENKSKTVKIIIQH